MAHVLHLLGTYPLAAGLLSQVIVLAVALKSGDRAAALTSAVLAATTASLVLRPPSPPDLVPDLIALGAGALLLTPGVQALLKLWKQKKTAREAR